MNCLLPRAPVTAQPEWCLPVLDSHSLEVKTAVYVGDPPWVVTSDFIVWAARVDDNPPLVQEVVARRPTGVDWVWRCRGTVEEAGVAVWERDAPVPLSGAPSAPVPEVGTQVWVCGYSPAGEYCRIPAQVHEPLAERLPGMLPYYTVRLDREGLARAQESELGFLGIVLDSQDRLLGLTRAKLNTDTGAVLHCRPSAVVFGAVKALSHCGADPLPGWVVHTLGVPLRDHLPFIGWQFAHSLSLVIPYLDVSYAERGRLWKYVSDLPTAPPPRQPTVDLSRARNEVPTQREINGLRSGDVIQQVNGQTIHRLRDVFEALRNVPPGESVPVAVTRGDKPGVVQVTVYGLRVPKLRGDVYGVTRSRCYSGLYAETPPAGYPRGLRGDEPDTEEPALLIRGVHPYGPGERAGLRVGEVIVAVDGKPLGESQPLYQVLSGFSSGQRIVLTLYRDGKRQRKELVLAPEYHPSIQRLDRYCPAYARETAEQELPLHLGLTYCHPPGLPHLPTTATVVHSVDEDSQCASQGVRQGDRLLSLDGRPVRGPDTLRRLLEDRKPNEVVRLQFGRGEGERFEVKIALIESVPEPRGRVLAYWD